ncbi:MAG: hydantoinase/oxoprolinase family protein [Gammaproteobacteria bacterium]
MSYIVATDVGGTCTDTVIASDDGRIEIGKVLSTPPEFAHGVLDSVRTTATAMGLTLEELLADTRLFVHGSTVVDNILLTHSGTPTALLTTAGFEDTLRVTRGAYGRWSGLPEDQIKHPVATERPAPLVDIADVRGISERIDYKGAVVEALDEAAAEASIRELLDDERIGAVAICLLWSFQNPAHEAALRAIVERIAPHCFVSTSAEIAPLPGEYERTSTTVINAYAGTETQRYVEQLQSQLQASGYAGPLLVMQGHGGLAPAGDAATRAVSMIECGPVAGLIGSRHLGEQLDDRSIIAVDIGGTTSKVGVIRDGALEYAREPMVNRYHYLGPKIEVASIGAGGGSIITLEPDSLAPRVGPKSAGASPGPVCYGMGGEQITLTDVLLLAGYMDPGQFLGGRMRLDLDRCRSVFARQIAEPLGLSVAAAAFGIFRVAASQLTDLIHEITVERGLDPRDYSLHAFGGTCPMLAGVFGAELNVARIVVPYTAAVNCAFGLAASDVVHEMTVPALVALPADPEVLNTALLPLIERGRAALESEGFTPGRIRIECAAALRYGLQVHEIVTPIDLAPPLDAAAIERLTATFESSYEQRYGRGSAYREAGIEITQLRVTARGLLERPQFVARELVPADPGAAQIGRRRIFVEARNDFVESPIFDFTKLLPGNVIAGPAVIHTPVTTIVVQQDQTARIDATMNTIIERA